ncbi:MAG TPA: histidinol-phosphate transaminase [Candidatus Hydrogenedentes bacterium]|nr:histidinol-phosphate transaminase [Candidatus Hydrogenedentota bacterium]
MKFGRDMLKDVEGYVPGEQPKMPNIVKLNTNENPYPPSEKVMAVLRRLEPETIRKYPDPLSLDLRTAAAERYGLDGADWVIAGNGMDELLALVIRTFVDPGDSILTTYPTYTLYETLAQLHGASIRMVHLDGAFQLTDSFFATPACIAILARPNAPSGVCAPRVDVERLCREFDGLVIIDEAYVDFADDHCLGFPARFDNAIVMRTFSKSFSLAGARLGLAFARPDIIAEFLKTKDSYNLNAITQAAGLAALEDYAVMETNAAKVRATRTRLTQALREMDFDVPESQANFVLARRTTVPSAADIFKALRERAIIVRYFDAPRLSGALRITIGTDAEIDTLLAALGEILHAGPQP